MTEQIMDITIDSIEHGLTKKKEPFIKVNEQYTAFDAGIILQITSNKGKCLRMKIVSSGEYKNIRGIISDESLAVTTEKPSWYNKDEPAKEVDKRPLISHSEAHGTEILPVKQNSKEFGKAGDRLKIYFDNAVDLQLQIDALKDLELFPKEE